MRVNNCTGVPGICILYCMMETEILVHATVRVLSTPNHNIQSMKEYHKRKRYRGARTTLNVVRHAAMARWVWTVSAAVQVLHSPGHLCL